MTEEEKTYNNESHDNETCSSDAKVKIYRRIAPPQAAPTSSDVLSFKLDFEKPKFKIVNGYLSPIPGTYGYFFEDTFTVVRSPITIIVTIPRQIFACNYGYEIPMGPNVFNNLAGAVKFNSASVIGIQLLDSGTSHTILVDNDNVGWITFTLLANRAQTFDLDNICSIHYSISFAPLKLNTLYSNCNCNKKRGKKCKCHRSLDSIKLDSNTYMELLPDQSNS